MDKFPVCNKRLGCISDVSGEYCMPTERINFPKAPECFFALIAPVLSSLLV